MTETVQDTKPAPREYGAGRDTVVKLRVTEDERDAWDAAADRAGQSRSEWMRDVLNGASVPPLRCVCDRYDADGSVLYDDIRDFLGMCREVHGETPMLTHRDGCWYDRDGTLVLEPAP